MRYFSKPSVRRAGIGGRFRPRLHQVGRIVDHRRHVALIGAAEIVAGLVVDIALVVDRGAEILGPQAARSGGCRDSRIVQPDRRHLARIARMIAMQVDAARRHAAGRSAATGFRGMHRRRPRRSEVSTGTSAVIGAGGLMPPGLRQPYHVGALSRGKAAAAHGRQRLRPTGWLPGSRSDGAGDSRPGCSRSSTSSLVCMQPPSVTARPDDQRPAMRSARLRSTGILVVIVARPCPASVGNKAVSAAIILRRIGAARNAVDAIDAAQQVGLRIGSRREAVIRTRQVLLERRLERYRASPAPSVRSGC